MMISILSIDAWNSPGGWQWNNWFRVGEIDPPELATLDSDQKIVDWLASAGYLKTGLIAGKDVEIDDDQYNIVISDPSVIDAPEDCDDSDRCEHTHCAMPILAIAYGEADNDA
jgi:hypothetical protein